MNNLRTHEIISLIAGIEDAHLLNWRSHNDQTGMQVPDFDKLLPAMERQRLGRKIFLYLQACASIEASGIMVGLREKWKKEKDQNEQED
jgi:hypothetical protein